MRVPGHDRPLDLSSLETPKEEKHGIHRFTNHDDAGRDHLCAG
jgi:hypothetical protein